MPHRLPATRRSNPRRTEGRQAGGDSSTDCQAPGFSATARVSPPAPPARRRSSARLTHRPRTITPTRSNRLTRSSRGLDPPPRVTWKAPYPSVSMAIENVTLLAIENVTLFATRRRGSGATGAGRCERIRSAKPVVHPRQRHPGRLARSRRGNQDLRPLALRKGALPFEGARRPVVARLLEESMEFRDSEALGQLTARRSNCRVWKAP